MELMDAIKSRHSYRSFRPQPIDRSLIEELVVAASLAPSSGNAQPWIFHVATGAARDRVVEVMSQTTVYVQEYLDFLSPERLESASRFYMDLGQAPVIVAVTMPKTDDELQRLNNCLAVGASIENFLLAATDKGLGTCTITFSFWVREELGEVLKVPQERSIVSLLLLGVPNEEPAAPPHAPDAAIFVD